MAHVDWTWLFVDAPAGRGDRSLAFWSAVTGTTPSTPRGDRDQFVTLRPPSGPAWLKHQRTRDGAGGVHVDLDVVDPTAVADRAVAMGATVTATVDVDPDSGTPGLVVLRSPGGFPLCLVRSAGDRGPVDRAGDRAGAARLADQVCLDIPPGLVDGEVAFWAALTGWESGSSVVREEFHWLETPLGHPVRVLLQRLDDPGDGVVRGHLDIACRDRTAETARHLDLGAGHVADFPFWTVMQDPVGATYCLTDRDPETGTLDLP